MQQYVAELPYTFEWVGATTGITSTQYPRLGNRYYVVPVHGDDEVFMPNPGLPIFTGAV
jgi:hypothetical protein